jgi:DNA-binding HxlR family transcriptional regulator
MSDLTDATGPTESGPTRIAFLLHHRWALPLLAELDRSSGAKSITLQKRLGVGRDSLGRTLGALIEAGLVIRNPGYGHPLRPEYVLTARGRHLGPTCGQLQGLLATAGAEAVALCKWSLPVVLALGGRWSRFSELRGVLPQATPRALALALRRLESARLVERRVVDEHPPRTVYQLTPRSRRWVPALEAAAARLAADQHPTG